MQITNISEAKSSLSRLIERVQNTDDVIIIEKAGKPVAVLSAFKASHADRILGGSWEGSVRFEEGADCASAEWIDAFYESEIMPKETKSP